ncbi:DUF7848 domain-containing protein [Streptomyces wuyuanensis]|uniref:DUF7848 domain-containing protein n=1 Tax=Streptomyces wuyuanensis TaxID=1196353 RepID=UPI0034223667
MPAHTIIRFADWTISPETTPPSPPIVHQFECATCNAEGAADEDFETARTWTFQHVGKNPSHQSYREIIHRFWRMHLVN